MTRRSLFLVCSLITVLAQAPAYAVDPLAAEANNPLAQSVDRWTLVTSALVYYGKCKADLPTQLTAQEEKNLVENALFSKAIAMSVMAKAPFNADKKTVSLLFDNGTIGIRTSVRDAVKDKGCSNELFAIMRKNIPEVAAKSIREIISVNGKEKPKAITDAQVKKTLDALK